MKKYTDPKSVNKFTRPGQKTAALFTLSQCPFCRKFEPDFAALAPQHPQYKFVEVVLDDYDCRLWEELTIEVVPTVIIFEGEKILSRADGRAGIGLKLSDLPPL